MNLKFQPLLGTCIFLIVTVMTSCINAQEGQKKSHKCQRSCKKNDEELCMYHFEIEKYYVMSKACYQCPFKPEDCERPDCIAADGVKRLLTVINRKLPGEAIQICDGDSVEIVVHNLMSEESTSIHWHGLHQNNYQFMDGVGLLTQCPIHPMMSFKYFFKPYPSGTHMFHAHMGFHKADGIFGGFVVRKPIEDEFHKDLYDEDLHEHLIIINDWIHEPGIDKYQAYYQDQGTNKPDTILINGKGRYKQFQNEDGQVFYTPVTKFTVTKGLRYRMRVISAGILYCPIEMMIDNHRMKIISTDGADVDAVEVDTLIVYAGERWDFILEASQDIGNYWMKFKGIADCNEKYNKAFNLAVLHYNTAADQLPNSKVTYESIVPHGVKVNPFNVASTGRSLKSVNKDPKSDPALGTLDLDPLIFAFDFYDVDNPMDHKSESYGYNQVPEEYRRKTPQINHISMKMPSFPPLSQPDDIREDTFCDEHQNRDCTKEFCWCTYLKSVPLNKVIEIILIDEGIAYHSNHPFHIHGYYCRVVAMEKIGDRTTVDEVMKQIRQKRVKINLIDPIYKDTWTVPTGGFTIVRCFLNNPGYWLFHCHLDFHTELGMSVIIKVGKDNIDIPPPPKNFPRCGDFN